jgi:outer membrane protein OmpA-like peptidoglycan-associated protein
MKGTACPDAEKIKDSLYSITRRHSNSHPGEPDTELADNPPNTGGRDIVPLKPNPGHSTDSLPEPRRVIDTPKVSQPRPVADTIVIHNIQFDFDKYLVQNPDTLQRYRRLLTRPGIKKIQVVGFTDDTGSESYNLDLSKKRSREVARLLSSKFNIPTALIEAEGRGISRTYPTKDLNRRVEIYIFHE